MGRKSLMHMMGPELRQIFLEKLGDPSLTQAQIAAHMRELGAEVSESAVQREQAKWRAMGKEMQNARELARVMGRELADADEHGELGRLLVERCMYLLMQATADITSGEQVDDKKIARMSTATRDLTAALKSLVDTEFKIRDRALKDAAKAAASVAAEAGVSDATIDLIKQRILGVAK